MSDKLIKKLNDRISSNKTAVGFIEAEIPKYEETIGEFIEITIPIENKIISVTSEINLLQEQIVSVATSAFNVGCGTTTGATIVYPDTVKTHSENVNSSSYDGLDPFGGQTSSVLSSSNVGFGTFLVFTQNDSSQTGLGTLYGTIQSCFRLPCTGSVCIDYNDEIVSLQNQIVTLRGQLPSEITKVNSIRTEKKNSEIERYGQKRGVAALKERNSQMESAISEIQNLDTPGGMSTPEGLFLQLDASNNSSYPGSGTIWYDLTDNNDSNLGGSPPANFIEDPVSEERNRFNFDGTDDFVDFTVANVVSNTPTVTVELLAKLKSDINTNDPKGHMLFGWYEYSVWSGPISGNGTPIALGFNTGNADLYGINSTNVNNLGLIDNFIHYVFEMRSDDSYTKNKIYINGSIQSLTEISSTNEDSSVRNFNSGNGRIAGWKSNNLYRIPMELSLFRVYNRALTSNEVQSLYNGVSGRFS